MSTSDLFTFDHEQTARIFQRLRPAPEPAETAAAAVTLPRPIGALAFRDGIPTRQTANMLYDNLDFLHAVDAFLKGFPAVALHRLREAQRRATRLRPDALHIFFKPVAAKPRLPTQKAFKYDAWSFIDLEMCGPAIVDFPATMVGVVDDMWSRLVMDLGPAGPDGGRGGQYLLLPPCADLRIPQGYTVLRPRTNGVWLYVRRPSARSWSDATKIVAEKLKIYALTASDTARRVELTEGSGLIIRDIFPDGAGFFEDLDRLVQTEPLASLDKSWRSLFASIGIVKGRKFCPDLRMESILADAAAVGAATVRAMNHYPPDLRFSRYRGSRLRP